MSKPKTSGYSETFPIGQTGHFQKIWHEEEHEPGDDPRQVLYKCKKIVTDFFYESNKAAEKQQQEVKKEDNDKEFLEAKKIVTDMTKQEALEWLSNNVTWKYNIDLKAIVNQKK